MLSYFVAAGAKNRNHFAVQAQDALEALVNDAGAVPGAFPATVGAFRGLTAGQTQQLLTFYGLAPGVAGLQTPTQRLAAYIGLRITV
jgi:hypothetical protein